MRSSNGDPLDDRQVEELLSATLSREADAVAPSPDALRRIQSRLVSPTPSTRPLPSRTLAPRRRWALAAATAGLAVAAAVTVVAVTAVRPEPTPLPDPATSPSAPSAPFTAKPASSLRKVLPVYRAGQDGSGADSVFLGREWAPVVQPFSERQALEALLNTRPVDPDLGAATPGTFGIASVTKTSKEIVVDLAANDTTLIPQGKQPGAVAERWVQAWIYTIQDAYSTELPVRITLRGAPTTLYGYVDTRRPIRRAAGLRIVAVRGIFSPRDGSSVTSPVNLSALAPDGVARWTVYEDTSGKKVFGEQAEDSRVSEDPGTFSAELPAGRYRAVYERVADSTAKPAFRRSVTFTVTGPAPQRSARPVTNPETTPIPVTPILRPGKGGALTPEWVVRPAEPTGLVRRLLDTMLIDPASKSRPLPAARVASVTSQGGRTVVELSDLAPTADVTAQTARLRAQALVATLSEFHGAPQEVLITLNGNLVPLFGDRDPSRPITSAPIKVDRRLDVSSSVGQGAAGPLVTIIGGLPPGTLEVVYFLTADGSDDVLYQGSVPGITGGSSGFGFSLSLPVGDYRLEVAAKNSDGSSAVVSDLSVRR